RPQGGRLRRLNKEARLGRRGSPDGLQRAHHSRKKGHEMPAKIYYDQDADLGLLKGRKIAIIGYGSQGHAHALNLKDSGQDVVVGLYKGSKSWSKAEKEGLRVATVNEANQMADVIMTLLPARRRDRDDVQGRDRDRSVRRADDIVRRHLSPDQVGVRDAGGGRIPTRGRLLRVHARDEADRRPLLSGRPRLHALLGLRHGRVRRLHPRPAHRERRDQGRDEEDPRRDPVWPVRPRVGAGEPGQPGGVPRDAPARCRAPDRRGRQAATRHDVVDQAATDGMSVKVSVAREGWPFIVVPAVLGAGLVLAGRRALALPFAAASLASLGFLRDPEREVPAVPGGVLSPADGRVLSVDAVEDRFVGPAG